MLVLSREAAKSQALYSSGSNGDDYNLSVRIGKVK